MTNKLFFNNLECPYCGHTKDNNTEVVFPILPSVDVDVTVVCNSDEGGCDKKFLMIVKTAYKYDLYKLELSSDGEK